MASTRERRIFLHWKSLKRTYDYRHGDGQSVLMKLARHWKMPIREIKSILEAHRGA